MPRGCGEQELLQAVGVIFQKSNLTLSRCGTFPSAQRDWKLSLLGALLSCETWRPALACRTGATAQTPALSRCAESAACWNVPPVAPGRLGQSILVFTFSLMLAQQGSLRLLKVQAHSSPSAWKLSPDGLS